MTCWCCCWCCLWCRMTTYRTCWCCCWWWCVVMQDDNIQDVLLMLSVMQDDNIQDVLLMLLTLLSVMQDDNIQDVLVLLLMMLLGDAGWQHTGCVVDVVVCDAGWQHTGRVVDVVDVVVCDAGWQHTGRVGAVGGADGPAPSFHGASLWQEEWCQHCLQAARLTERRHPPPSPQTSRFFPDAKHLPVMLQWGRGGGGGSGTYSSAVCAQLC